MYHVKIDRMKAIVDKNETLRYLGYKGGHIPGDVNRMISECIAEIEETAYIRYVYRVFATDETPLAGEDIAKHLEGCRECVIMAATLGMEADNLVRKTQALDMARAVILDACGSSAIENACDRIEEMLRREWEEKGMYVTGRFSPGYGDMPMSQQKELCNLLDAQRKAGIYITSGNAMIPVKSVTAVMGISDKNVNNIKIKTNCGLCGLAESCNFRKEGARCEKSNCSR